jgi:hypothetical protein
MSRSAASSCSLVNSSGDWEPFPFPPPFSCAVSLATLFFGTAMAIPDQRKRLFLSIPTQTAMKGLRDAAGIRNAAVQCSATFSSLILEDFEI